MQFFIITCKKRNNFMNLGWRFSFPMASICYEQMYTQTRMYTYCPPFIHLLRLKFSVHSMRPIFPPNSDTQLIIHLVYVREEYKVSVKQGKLCRNTQNTAVPAPSGWTEISFWWVQTNWFFSTN